MREGRARAVVEYISWSVEFLPVDASGPM